MTEPPRRRLSTATLTFVVVANMLGAGVFTTSGFALADLGSRGWVMAAWGLGGGVALLGALCYAALAQRLRESGGEYLFLSRALHPCAGFLAGWVSLWAGFTGAIAFAGEAVGVYLAPILPAGWSTDAVGVAAIALCGLLHGVRLGAGVWVQNALVVCKLAMLVGLVAWGVSALPALPAPVAVEAPSVGAFAATLMWVSLSYSGWNAAVYVAGEARDPGRGLRRAMFGGTAAVVALYLALNWVFVASAPIDRLAGVADIGAVAAEALGGEGLASLLRVILVLAMLTSISSMVMVGPRVYAQMAADGVLPRWLGFGRSLPRTAILLQVVLSAVVLCSSDLRAQLTNLGWILGVSTALTVLALLRLRRREGGERVPISGYPWVPVGFLVAVAAQVGAMLVVRGAELGPGLVILGSGLAIDLGRRLWVRTRAQN